MKKCANHYAVAVDLGASGGKMAAASFDGSRIELADYITFPNQPVQILDTLYWDVFALYRSIVSGMTQYASELGPAATIGIDTWGVDFGLLDAQGRLLAADFVATVEEDLARRDFTINAIAESQDSLMDPYDGRADIKNKLIRTVGDAGVRFREDPLRMIKALRLAAELDFDLHKSVYDAIVSGHTMLSDVNPSKIRDEFTGMLSAPAAGKGLSMLLGTGMIADIIGQDAVDRLTKREMQDLTTLSQNIDKTQPVEDRRLGLFFACMDKKKVRPAIDRLNFNEVTHQHLVDAVNDLPKLYFTNNKPALKKFIYQRSMERYEFLLSMEKAQRIVFSYDSETKIRSKIFMLDEIHKFGEPIFPEDLKIDANDLIEAGICDRDKAQKILNMLTEEIHTHPKKNTREQLLKLAKVYSKNKVAAALRGIHWTR